jgi:hypothetical protein
MNSEEWDRLDLRRALWIDAQSIALRTAPKPSSAAAEQTLQPKSKAGAK